MKIRYKLEYDKVSNKIITDTMVDDAEYCRSYFFTNPTANGYGVIATRRDICVKKLMKILRDNMNDLIKETKRYERIIKKLEKEL